MKIRIKARKLLRQHKGLRNKIEMSPSILLLHRHNRVTHPILPRNLKGTRKMINPLMFIESFIQILLPTTPSPYQIPIMRVRMPKSLKLQCRPHKPSIRLIDPIQHVLFLSKVTLGILITRRALPDHLILGNRFKINQGWALVCRGCELL